MSEVNVNDIRKKLDEKIPRNAVSERKGGGNQTFSYLQGHYVIARMNEVFGNGNWRSFVQSCACVHSGEVGDKYTVHYIATVRIEVPLLGAIYEDVGYGDGSDKVNIGKAHELAAKEAVTDALKRAAKNLGMSMGLALYDKEQVNVDDGEETTPPKVEKVEEQKPAKTDRKALLSLISVNAEIITKRKLKTFQEVKAMLAEYGVEKKEDLADEQAQQFLNRLKDIASPQTQASA